ncbi:MAG: protein translocase subunit SecD [Desulfatibacillaceae bacterium]|nr:protein translocase subunit SecD [Desulfatibacillaceae bacterium]
MRQFKWRLALVLVVTLAAVLLLFPSVDYYSKDRAQTGPASKENTLWPHKVFNLGLDLQGGMHLVLEVQAEKAVESLMERKLHDMRDELRTARIRHTDFGRDAASIHITLLGNEAISGFEKMMDDQFPELAYLSRTAIGDNLTVVLNLPEGERSRVMENAVGQALETLRTRVDEFGVEEPQLVREGRRRILIQLPGIKDAEKAKQRLGETAILEFKLVDDNLRAEDYALDPARLPVGRQILPIESKRSDTGRVIRENIVVMSQTLLTGDYISEARVRIDSDFGMPYVSLKFNRKGGQIFAQITGDNVGRRLAIVLDGVVRSAPVIRDRISGGEAMIEGNFSDEEARDLVRVLQTALPAPVKILEERTVGPSLGADSIRMGRTAMIIGGLLVLLFIPLYYKGAGLIADLAVMLNMVMIFAGLALLSATLTLPGIAGLVLTIGMAVDANVLIFERIREELRAGKSPGAAVDGGYGKAVLTILDANITTLISALVLFQFGTGPVRGFAVTLSMGIVCSLFTAIVVTRVIFDYLVYYRRVRQLSI